MKYGIIGRGFGLYAYLPAVAERTSEKINTLEAYRGRFSERSDIAAYADRIAFKTSPQDVFAESTVVVVALRPADQFALVSKIVESGWRGILFMEKPVAPTPEESLRLVNFLIDAKIVFRFGFTLAATDWFRALATNIQTENHFGKKRVKILWNFCAHHYRHDLPTWKRFRPAGGGALRFYGIHLIAGLAGLGEWQAKSYSAAAAANGEEPECSFEVSNGICDVGTIIKTDWLATQEFSVQIDDVDDGSAIYRLSMEDPFSESNIVGFNQNPYRPTISIDNRIVYLRRIIDSHTDDSNKYYSIYKRHIKIWNDLEDLIV